MKVFAASLTDVPKIGFLPECFYGGGLYSFAGPATLTAVPFAESMNAWLTYRFFKNKEINLEPQSLRSSGSKDLRHVGGVGSSKTLIWMRKYLDPIPKKDNLLRTALG